MKKELLLAAIFLLLTAAAILTPIAPLYQPIPVRDQGVYLYVGQQILEGAIPYRDVWDHKGPLIYYINALGLSLTDSVWGVWFLEVVFLFLAAVTAFLALRLVFDFATAFSSAILWLVALPLVLDHGSSVEEYSLLFQFAAIYFYLRSEKNSNGYWNEVWVGLMAALAFSLRPNNIGAHLAIALVLLSIAFFFPKERLRTFKRILAAALGSATIFGIIGIYFAANHALGDLLDQVFIFNYHYSKLKDFSWLALVKGYTTLAVFFQLGLAGLVGLFVYLYQIWRQPQSADNLKTRFAFLTLVFVPIQLYLSLMSGRKYLHYYIAWLPVLALLIGFLIFWVSQYAGIRQRHIFRFLLAAALLLAFGAQPVFSRMPPLINLAQTIHRQKSLPQPNYSAVERGEYVQYILKHTQPDDYVLIWGNASVYNFLTERKPPARFVYTYPFGVPNYVSQEIVDELLLAIAQKKPMIIDATARDKTIPGINAGLWKDLPITQDLIRFIETHYTHVDTVGSERFRIWLYQGD